MYCISCGALREADSRDQLLCQDCFTSAESHMWVGSNSLANVVPHYCHQCGAALGNQQGVPLVERIWCEKHRRPIFG